MQINAKKLLKAKSSGLAKRAQKRKESNNGCQKARLLHLFHGLIQQKEKE